MECQARLSAPDGFSFGTNKSEPLFQPPEALGTLMSFPDALFAHWGSCGRASSPCEHSVRAGIFGQGKEWTGL